MKSNKYYVSHLLFTVFQLNSIKCVCCIGIIQFYKNHFYSCLFLSHLSCLVSWFISCDLISPHLFISALISSFLFSSSIFSQPYLFLFILAGINLCLSYCVCTGCKQDWSIQWPTSESGKENTPVGLSDHSQWVRLQLSQSPKLHSRYSQHLCQSPQALVPPFYSPHLHSDRLTVDPHSGLFPMPLDMGHHSLPPSPRQRHFAHTPPWTPLVVNTMTPPGTPQVRRRNKLKAPGTPPPASRKLIHLMPGFTALHRSKSHEFQLGNRIDDAQTPK